MEFLTCVLLASFGSIVILMASHKLCCHIAFVLIMVATFSCDAPSCSSQASTTLNTVAIDPDNLTDAIFQNFQQNLKPCKSFDL